MALFFQILAFKNVLKYLFYSGFWTSPKICPKKGHKKNDNCWHFAKHRFIIKNRFVATPLLTKKFCVLKLFVLKPKPLCWTKKHNLKSGNSKDKRKGLERTKRKYWWRKTCNLICWCCSFHETKAKKKEKERKRQKEGTKRKQKKETRRKKERKEEKRETEKEKEKKREA